MGGVKSPTGPAGGTVAGQGFEFLGHKMKRGVKRMKLAPEKIKSGARQGAFLSIFLTKHQAKVRS